MAPCSTYRAQWLVVHIFSMLLVASYPDNDLLLSWTRKTMNRIKIYIYPKIPNPEYPAYKSFEFYNSSNVRCNHHFLLERKFAEFLRNNYIETTVPSRADYFLIDHDYACHFSTNGNNSVGKRLEHEFSEMYLTHVIQNVVQNYPYYNRSGGLDHLMVFTLDRGRCEMSLHPGLRPVIPLYEPVTFIGNFGFAQEDITFDTMRFGKNAFIRGELVTRHLPGCTLFGSGRNIVVPQYHEWSPEQYQKHFRHYHSVFVGRVKKGGISGVNVRPILLNIHSLGFAGFFVSDNSNASQSTVTIQDSYFSLCPGGAAPWSVRMYDAIFHHSIPVILADGIILPFERFLDWKLFTIKQNSEFQRVKDGVVLLKKLKRFALDALRHSMTIKTVSAAEQKNFIHRKLFRASSVMPWLSWNAESPHSAYGLLLLELWCKIYGYTVPVCRPMLVNGSELAYLSYW